MKKQTLGVVVGRFQVSELHAGHRYLIETALSENDVVMVILGDTGGFPTKRNPLPSSIRASIISEAFPSVGISVLRDTASDEMWSTAPDAHIGKRAGDDSIVTLYASRDGFASSYQGKYAVKTLPAIPALSGTEMRDASVNGAMAYVIDRPKEAG